jgi:hypothetical protein
MSRHDATEPRMIRRRRFGRQGGAGRRQPHVVVLTRGERKMRPAPSRRRRSGMVRESRRPRRNGPASPVNNRQNTGAQLCGPSQKHRMRVKISHASRRKSKFHRQAPSANPERKIYNRIGAISSPKCTQDVDKFAERSRADSQARPTCCDRSFLGRSCRARSRRVVVREETLAPRRARKFHFGASRLLGQLRRL